MAKIYTYELRHDDSDWSVPAYIEDKVVVNFWGVLKTKKPIKTPKELSLEEKAHLIYVAQGIKKDSNIVEIIECRPESKRSK